MAHFENETEIVREYETQADALAAIAEGGELHEYLQDGYTDPEGRQLTKAEIEWLIEVGKWVIRILLGIPIP